jgi:hypothetical protein
MGDSISAVFAGAAIGLLCFLWPHVAALRKRITRVEGKLDLLLKEAGLQYDPFSDVPDDVAEAVRSGKRMLAIELYRKATDSNLRDAQERIGDLLFQSGVNAAADPDANKGGLIMMGSMVGCSLLGAILSVLIGRPDWGSYSAFVVIGIGAIPGAFVGLILGIIVFRAARRRGLQTK